MLRTVRHDTEKYRLNNQFASNVFSISHSHLACSRSDYLADIGYVGSIDTSESGVGNRLIASIAFFISVWVLCNALEIILYA